MILEEKNEEKTDKVTDSVTESCDIESHFNTPYQSIEYPLILCFVSGWLRSALTNCIKYLPIYNCNVLSTIPTKHVNLESKICW